jgi:hypothetical protein
MHRPVKSTNVPPSEPQKQPESPPDPASPPRPEIPSNPTLQPEVPAKPQRDVPQPDRERAENEGMIDRRSAPTAPKPRGKPRR